MTQTILFSGSLDDAERLLALRIDPTWALGTDQRDGKLLVRVAPELLPTPCPDDLITDIGEYRVEYVDASGRLVEWPASERLRMAVERLSEALRRYDWFVRVDPVVIAKSNPGHKERLYVTFTRTDSWIEPQWNSKDPAFGAVETFDGFHIYYREEMAT